MGYFETYPWLLVIIIIVTVEAWAWLKTGIKAAHRYFSQRKLLK